MGVKRYVNTTICREKDENGQGKNSVTVFKKGFSKDIKDLWSLLENSEDDVALIKLYDKVKDSIQWLEFLKRDLLEYSSYSEEKDEFI